MWWGIISFQGKILCICKAAPTLICIHLQLWLFLLVRLKNNDLATFLGVFSFFQHRKVICLPWQTKLLHAIVKA